MDPSFRSLFVYKNLSIIAVSKMPFHKYKVFGGNFDVPRHVFGLIEWYGHLKREGDQERGPRGHQLRSLTNYKVKKFTFILNFNSSPSYEYIQVVFFLLHTNSLTEWTPWINCELCFFMNVWEHELIRVMLINNAVCIVIIQIVTTVVILIMVKVLLFLTRMLLQKEHKFLCWLVFEYTGIIQ